MITDPDIIRVFPRRTSWTPTDDYAFIGEPLLFRPGDRTTPVRISVTFTWDMDEAERIAPHWSRYYDDVQVGGPAYSTPTGEFVPGRFMRKGCVITTRGCPKKCPWCCVPTREGKMRELPIPAGWIVQDNNILASSDAHCERVFDMLREQDRNASFPGGLDKHFIKPHHVELFRSIKVGELWFACDVARDMRHLQKAREMLGDHFKPRQLRCYTMIGFEGQSREALRADIERIEAVFAMGFLPFTQLYQPMERTPIDYSPEWLAAKRYWSRPAIYRGRNRRPLTVEP